MSRPLAWLADGWPVIGLVLALLAVCGLLSLGDTDLQRAGTTALINLIVVVGLYLFIGNSGVFSFGHIGFMAIGAYTTAILTIPAFSKALVLPELPDVLKDVEMAPIVGVLAAAAVGTMAGFIFGLPLMRLSGLAAGIATLALLVIVNQVLSNLDAVSGGAGGTLTGIPLATTLWSALGWAILAIAIAFAFQSSRIGLRLRAAREDEPAARAIGVGVQWERRIAFSLSAGIVALGGALHAQFIGSISPDLFFFQLTFLTLAMLVVGGIGSLAGAVLGVGVISLVAESFSRLEEGSGIGPLDVVVPVGFREIVIALIMLAVLLTRPDGLSKGRELRTPAFLRGWGSEREGVPAGSSSGGGGQPDSSANGSDERAPAPPTGSAVSGDD